jgi:hypothetical protein
MSMKALWACTVLLVTRLAASDLRPDEQLLLFPSLGQRLDPQQWQLSVHGWVFESPTHPLPSAVLLKILGWSGDLSETGQNLVQERARYFSVDNERGKTVTLRVGPREFRGARSGANGHFISQVTLPDAQLGPAFAPGESRWISCERRPRHGDTRMFAGRILLLAPTGWSIVSDIDDTIKISEVANPSELMRNTFSRPFQAVPGMAELYQAWASRLGAQFHYVSASPWQLYPTLEDFRRQAKFPAGTYHLKYFRLKDETFFDLFRSPAPHKRSEIELLLQRWPKRHFVLVGDCGEKDPEVYGALARAYPEQIQAVFIRELHGAGAHADRFATAFAEVAPARWRVFQDPAELRTALGPVKNKSRFRIFRAGSAVAKGSDCLSRGEQTLASGDEGTSRSSNEPLADWNIEIHGLL